MSRHSRAHSAVPAEVVDPVCGMTTSPGDSVRHVEHKGQTYYFCSESWGRVRNAAWRSGSAVIAWVSMPLHGGLSILLLAAASWAFAPSQTFDGLQPQLAAVDDRVALTFGRDDRVYVATSSDRGATFAEPAALPGTGRLSLGMRRGPRIAMTSRALIVAAVVGQKGGGADGDVLIWRSADDGVQWGSPEVLNDVPGSAREGMHALASNDQGLLVAAWLDLRQKGTRIYAAVSADHGSTWRPDVLVYDSPSGTVCQCCHPSVAIAANGAIAVMFRNSLDGNRDMYVAVSRDAGRTFTTGGKQGLESWPLNACPMDGGDVEWIDDRIASVWRRAGDVFSVLGDGPERLLGAGADPIMSVHQRAFDLA
jgi:YHS domain-containing protein